MVSRFGRDRDAMMECTSFMGRMLARFLIGRLGDLVTMTDPPAHLGAGACSFAMNTLPGSFPCARVSCYLNIHVLPEIKGTYSQLYTAAFPLYTS